MVMLHLFSLKNFEPTIVDLSRKYILGVEPMVAWSPWSSSLVAMQATKLMDFSLDKLGKNSVKALVISGDTYPRRFQIEVSLNQS